MVQSNGFGSIPYGMMHGARERPSAVRDEIHKGHFLYTGNRSREVVLTEQTLGCLLEFQVAGDNGLFYSFAQNFQARQI